MSRRTLFKPRAELPCVTPGSPRGGPQTFPSAILYPYPSEVSKELELERP